MLRLDKDCTTRTSRYSDSASDSSAKGGTDRAISSTQNSVVEEKRKASYFRDFRDEIFILRHTLEDGPLAFFQQFRSTRLTVKLAVSLLPILFLLIIAAVLFIAAQYYQRSYKSSLPTNLENSSEPTMVPSQLPSDLPSLTPSDLPSLVPSGLPSVLPSNLPSVLPSNLPSVLPSGEPSEVPSDLPSVLPSGEPSGLPSALPTLAPTISPTKHPTPNPTPNPTRRPTQNPTPRPTSPPTEHPTKNPTHNPTRRPTRNPTLRPSSSPTKHPTPNLTPPPPPANANVTYVPTTSAPSKQPTPPPTPPTPPPTDVRVSYIPGKLNRRENGLLLSEGLRSRIVARSGQRVKLDGRNDERSDRRFHDLPDGAAVFADPNSNGGWAYVSNSEVKEPAGQGGVGAIYFDRHGRTVNYRMLETGTTANCSGGKTPWNTWVTCEESENGRALQVDPFGNRRMQELTMDRGVFEAFAYDIRDKDQPRFFITEDKEHGPIRRFSPSETNWEDPWQLLHAPGKIEYLVLEPRGGGKGTFRWTTDEDYANANAAMYYPFTEGIDVYRHQLFFTSKEKKELFILHLDKKTFEKQTTVAGIFDGMPDQVKRIAGDGLLYFCEEGGIENGVHARDENGWYFTVLESDTFNDESTGLAFSPDGKRMYVAFQKTGQIFDVWREDGLPFNGQTLNVRYHEFRQRR